MDWDPYNDLSLKRPYPFEYDEIQSPLEQSVSIAGSSQLDSPIPVDSSFQSDEPNLCLLGAVSPPLQKIGQRCLILNIVFV
jgi:hypothetical protein